MAETNNQNFVPALCTQCGAPIDVNPDLEAGVCPYCGSPFVTSKAINKYYTTNNIHNTTNVHNSNDTYNVQVGKKGIAQSAFDYLGKRAEARERAEAEQREQARQEEMRRRMQQEQAAIRSKKFWRGVGQFLLWLYFFPIMLIITLVKRSQIKKENAQRMANGYELIETPPLPIAFMIVGGFFFLILYVPILFGGNSKETDADKTASAAPAVVQETATPTLTPQSRWYNQKAKSIEDLTFDVETKSEQVGIFQYEVPVALDKKVGNDGKSLFYFPPGGSGTSFIQIYLQELDLNFDNVSEDDVNAYLDAFANTLIKNEGFSDGHAFPVMINGTRGMALQATYTTEGRNIAVFLYVYPVHSQVLAIGNFDDGSDYAFSNDDCTKILNSVTVSG